MSHRTPVGDAATRMRREHAAQRRRAHPVGHIVTSSAASVHFELFSTSFCGACRQTRLVLDRVLSLIPGSTLAEHDLAFEPDLAKERGIEHSPTTIIRDDEGRELFRAVGVPTVPHVLVAAERAIAAAQEFAFHSL